MNRIVIALAVLALVSCSDGTPDIGFDPDGDWLEMWVDSGFERRTLDDGTAILVDEDSRTIYVEDCARADELTSEGGEFGPSERDERGDFEWGYGSVCRVGWTSPLASRPSGVLGGRRSSASAGDLLQVGLE